MEDSLGDRSGGRVEATAVRRAVLLRLVACADELAVLRVEVGALPAATDKPLVDLRAWNVAELIRRTQAGELTTDELRAWATLVEHREDLRTDERVEEAIFELATPEHVEPMTPSRLAALLAFVGSPY
ncbi:MAG: hypothetical protein J7513_04820 [Solirubrobacteraceae bacterium]|nr:hypothetical protein [Solirubrobacteraceae bacterium]